MSVWFIATLTVVIYFATFCYCYSILLPPVSSNSGSSVFGTEAEPAPGDPRSETDNDLEYRFIYLKSRFTDLESRFIDLGYRMLWKTREVGPIMI